MNNSSIFSLAKIEYNKQLIDVLKYPIYDKFKSIYDESKNHDSIINGFRLKLNDIPKWNTDILENEIENIINLSNCDWIDDLITAVFVSHIKILASINNKEKQINLVIPKSINFIHKCFINIARELWKNPYLFDESITGWEYQRNIKMIESIIIESIELV